MPQPVIFTSQFPPSTQNLRGAIAMRLASGGADVDDLVEDFVAMAADFTDYFPHDTPVDPADVPAIIDEVVEEYQRVVTTMSPDADGLLRSLDDTLRAGILYSYGDAYEPADALEFLEDAFEAVTQEGGALRGFLYSLVGDLDEMVLHGRLEVNFGTFDGDSSEVPAVAHEAVRIFTGHGLKAQWSGNVEDPIVIEPMVVDAPLVAEGDEDTPAHEHEHHHEG